MEESVRRCVERDGATEEAARSRIKAQIDLKTRIDKSNVIISTVWEPEVTQKLVEKAWKLLHNRIE